MDVVHSYNCMICLLNCLYGLFILGSTMDTLRTFDQLHPSKELMNGLSETPIPGGFGATAGPNDGWHQCMHAVTKGFLRLAVGWGSELTLRKRMDEICMGVQAAPSTKFLVCKHLDHFLETP